MKIIVVSDSHGSPRNLSKVVERHLDADMLIHLGDGQREYETLSANYPHLKSYYVAGNCDYDSLYPNELVLDVGYGVKLFATHGHRHCVKYSLEILQQYAREAGCQIALFGHTHERYCSYEDGLYTLNPGSVSCPRDGLNPSYGVVDVSKAGIVTNVVDV